MMVEEQGLPGALSDANFVGREGRAYLILFFFNTEKKNFEPPKQKGTDAVVDFD
jgi:hypothetical protein